MRSQLILLAGLATLSACATDSPRSYFTPSEALAQQDSLDGQRVKIGGVVVLGTNARCLWDSLFEYRRADGSGRGVVTLSRGAELYPRADELNPQFVIVEGVFLKRFNGPDDLDLYQCNEAGIEQETITTSRR